MPLGLQSARIKSGKSNAHGTIWGLESPASALVSDVTNVTDFTCRRDCCLIGSCTLRTDAGEGWFVGLEVGGCAAPSADRVAPGAVSVTIGGLIKS